MGTAFGGSRWGQLPDFRLAPHQHPAGRAERDANRSILALATLPVVLVVGFVAGSLLFGDPNAPGAIEGWAAMARLVPFWLLLEVPSMLGMFWGLRSMKQGDRGGRVGLLLNAVVFTFLVATTLLGGSLDAFD